MCCSDAATAKFRSHPLPGGLSSFAPTALVYGHVPCVIEP
jgi:hypothetical protein